MPRKSSSRKKKPPAPTWEAFHREWARGYKAVTRQTLRATPAWMAKHKIWLLRLWMNADHWHDNPEDHEYGLKYVRERYGLSLDAFKLLIILITGD